MANTHVCRHRNH